MLRLVVAGLSMLLLAPIALAQNDAPKIIRGQLNADDDFDAKRKKSYHKVHVVKLMAGKTYQIDLTASFDTFLRLEDSNKNELAFDDDGGNGFNSRLSFSPRKTADYRIIVTSFPPEKTGTYRLSIRKPSKLQAKFQKLQNEYQQAKAAILSKYRKAKGDAEKQKVLQQYYAVGGQFAPKALAFVMKHKNDPVAKSAVQWLVLSLRVGDALQTRYENAYKNKDKNASKLYDEAVETLEQLSKSFPAYKSRMESSLFKLQNLSIGKKAPEIDAEDIDGVRFKLSDYRGKVVVLDFWGDW
ncbi:MAG: peroxiredoxin family protein [Gemmataceae bacterium]